jgi:predicted nucleic acid-binding Zn ribbon protein
MTSPPERWRAVNDSRETSPPDPAPSEPAGAGDPAEPGEPTGIDLARAVLAAARAHAREMMAEPRPAQRRTVPRRTRRSDGRDPQPLAAAIPRLLADRGWEQPVTVGGVIGRWGEIVGSPIREHCDPVEFTDGVLVVRADSPAWATELRMLAGPLLSRLNAAIGTEGEHAITRIQVLGPGGNPSRPSLAR